MSSATNSEDNNNGFPYEIKFVDKQRNEKLLKDFHGEKTGFVQVGPNNYFFPSCYEKQASNYYNFEVRKDDIWIVSFPRSGTTLTQELVWMVGNDLNYKKALEEPLVERSPFFEFGVFFHEEIKKKLMNLNAHSVENQRQIVEISRHGWEFLPKKNQQRFIKTHLPFSLLPKDILTKGCKVFYVARNPKDVVVSYYHLNRLFQTQGFQGNFGQYWEYFEQNLQPWMPYWEHIKEGWEQRNNPNVMFLFYEDMLEDMKTTILKVADFLGKSLSDIQINELDRYLDFDNFRANTSVNMNDFKDLKIIKSEEQGFIRKGKVNGCNEEMTADLNKRVDKWIEEGYKKLDNTDFRFPKSKNEKIKSRNM